MKIVHVIPGLTKGGAERVVCDLANHAVEVGHSVTILAAARAPSEHVPSELNPQVKVVYICDQGFRPRAAYGRLLPWIVSNWGWLSSRDVVHCHLTFGSVFGTVLQGVRRLRGSATPVVVETYHAVGMPIARWKRWVDRLLLRHRDAVALMAVDPFWEMFRNDHPERVIRLIPNGISFNHPATGATRKSYRDKLGIPADALVVGSLGRMVPERRPGLFFEAFRNLIPIVKGEVHLVLAGAGSECERLQALAMAKGIGAIVHFPGLILDAPGLFDAFDVYWTTNVREFTGMAALEAANSGLPVLAVQLDATYRPTGSDWIPSSSSLGKLADMTNDLIQNPLSRSRLARAQAQHVRRNHAVKAMADSYFALYELARPEKPTA